MTVEMKSFLIGLIGSGLDGSLSPSMHEREGEQQGFRYIYKRIDLAKLNVDHKALPDLLRAAEQMGFTGLNITHPCKQEVIQYLDELSEEASSIGAVNTVLFRSGKRIGYNTDGRAFVDSFRNDLHDVKHDSIVLIGAGGAGTAIAHSLLNKLKTSLTILDEDSSRAISLSDVLNRKYGAGKARALTNLAEAIKGADGFINATPIGMEHSPGSVLPNSLLGSDLWVADIVYFPLETELLGKARAKGCRVMNGGGMAVRQAAAAFTIFTGQKADVLRMQDHFTSLVGSISGAHRRTAAAAE
jgi:shikimate dehydrogenase